MISTDRNKRGTLFVLAIAIITLALSAVFAKGEVGMTAAAGLTFKDSSDKALTTVGIDIAFGPRLEVVVTAKGKGALGDVKALAYDVDDIPKNAFGGLRIHECICLLGVIEEYPGGVIFTIDEVSPEKVITDTMKRLEALRVTVHREPGARSLSFRSNDIDYRAVFGAAPGGTLVYLGY